MRLADRIGRLFGNLFGRQQAEDTLDAELRAYIDELTHRNLSRGVPREEARRQALVEAGGIEQIKEEVRLAWLGNGIGTTVQDIRQACRTLLRSPGFTVVVVATLALGIGASLTMFSLMRAVLWRPLPYPEPNRMVTIQVDARNVTNAGASQGEVRDLKTRSRSLELVSTVDAGGANLEYGGEMEHVAAASVSDDFLPLLGAHPALGRTLDSRLDTSNGQARGIVDRRWAVAAAFWSRAGCDRANRARR